MYNVIALNAFVIVTINVKCYFYLYYWCKFMSLFLHRVSTRCFLVKIRFKLYLSSHSMENIIIVNVEIGMKEMLLSESSAICILSVTLSSVLFFLFKILFFAVVGNKRASYHWHIQLNRYLWHTEIYLGNVQENCSFVLLLRRFYFYCTIVICHVIVF